MAWIRTLGCCASLIIGSRYACIGGCSGSVQAHHAGERGLGQKADDSTCIPLCFAHHHDWHRAGGMFAGWSRAERRAWADRQIARHQALYTRRAA
jgi:hypothetical protein